MPDGKNWALTEAATKQDETTGFGYGEFVYENEANLEWTAFIFCVQIFYR